MKIKTWFYPLILIVVSLTLTSSCSKERAKEPPTVRTSEVTQITEYSAKCGGIVTLEGDAPVFERGICWDTIQAINEIKSPHIKNGEGFGEFIGSMSPLNDNTKFYVRAYATNNYGTGYGEIKTFTTLRKEVEDGRDKYIGLWEFIETQKSTMATSYIVNIVKDPNNISQVLLKNLGNPGSNDCYAIGIVTNSQIVVSSQCMSNGWLVEGTGKTTNMDKMSWTYSITEVGKKYNFTATATKQ